MPIFVTPCLFVQYSQDIILFYTLILRHFSLGEGYEVDISTDDFSGIFSLTFVQKYWFRDLVF